MASPDIHEKRKADHIRINLDEDVRFDQLTTGLERLHFTHNALPNLNLADINTSLTLFGKALTTPVFISSMTGGTAEAYAINRNLARAAQSVGMALGLGSMRAAIEDPSLIETFYVRDVAPDILLFANLGAVQLNYGYGVEHCLRAVEATGSDALILHFNVLQEAVQPEGDTNFSGLLDKVAAICQALPMPVIAKEVGWGFSAETVTQLVSAGISAIDTAGAGGTSWSQVEMYRAPTARHARIAATFRDWGIPTADAIRNCRQAAPALPILASGGLKTGIDVAKCIALGATMGGLAGDFLRAEAAGGAQAVAELAQTITDELRIAMLCTGTANLKQLGRLPLLTR